MKLYADRVDQLGTENAFKVGADIERCEASGRSVIRLNLGEPDFPTAAPIRERAKRELDAGNTRYCDPQGVRPLREAIARQVSATRDLPVLPEEVVVCPGAKPPILYTMLSYVNPGDEVVYPSPGYPIYESAASFVGGTPVPLHLEEAQGFRFSADALARLVTPRTKVIVLNSPSNPTGNVLPPEELGAIAEVVRTRCDEQVRILSDETYEQIVFEGTRHHSITAFPGMRARTVLISGHSKTYSMTGWRLGYAVLPTPEEASVFKNLNINAISCVPPFVQMAGKEALENPTLPRVVAEMRDEFQRRRDFVLDALRVVPGVRCQKPMGAFYAFPNVASVCESLGILEAYEALSAEEKRETSPSTMLQRFALFRHGVATMDRRSFGVIGSEGRHYLRLSTATDLASLREGVRRLAAAAADRRGFAELRRQGAYLG
jgi:aspartate/methionine/tyrosine aminotransferase